MRYDKFNHNMRNSVIINVLINSLTNSAILFYSKLLEAKNYALQISNADILTKDYIYLLDHGGGNLHRDFDTERAFES